MLWRSLYAACSHSLLQGLTLHSRGTPIGAPQFYVRRYEEKIVFIVFLVFIANQFAASVLFFFIVWLVMRTRSDVKLGVKWVVPGIFATAFVGGLARFAFWMVSGERVAAPLGDEAETFFFLVLPTLTAIGLCVLLRWHMRSKSRPMLGHEGKS